jgi:hypothetical protein
MVSLSDIKERAQQAVSSDSDDSGRIDQADARVERARQEAREAARREAQREQVEQRVQQAREDGRAAVDGADSENKGTLERVSDIIETATEQVADADGLSADDIDTAMGTDFDQDGEPLAGELGLQTNDRGAAENQAFDSLGARVDANEQGIASLESEVFGSGSQQQASRADPMSPGGFGGGLGGVQDEDEMLEQMGFNPDSEGL